MKSQHNSNNNNRQNKASAKTVQNKFNPITRSEYKQEIHVTKKGAEKAKKENRKVKKTEGQHKNEVKQI